MGSWGTDRGPGKKKRDNIEVKLLNYFIIIITEILFFFFFFFIIVKLDPMYVRYHFDVYFHCFVIFLSLRLSESLSPSLSINMM